MQKHWGSFAIGAMLVCLLIAAQWHTVLHPPAGLTGLHVFGSFLDSGWAARHGANPYAGGPLTVRLRAFGDHGPWVPEINLNPPTVLPVFALLTYLSPEASAFVWSGLLALVLLSTAAFLVHREELTRMQVSWLLTSGASIGTIAVMQDYQVLLLLSLAAWHFLQRQEDRYAGVCLGILVAIKPNLILWPIFLALSGRRKPIPAALMSCVALSLLPVIIYGSAVYPEWLRAVSADIHWLSPQDASIAGVFGRMGLHGAGRSLALALLVALTLTAWIAKPDTRQASGMASCGAILCSPIGWMGFALIVFPLTLGRAWSTRQKIAMTILWFPPFLLGPADALHWRSALMGITYCVAFCLLLAEFAGEPLRNVIHRSNRIKLAPAGIC